MVNMMETKSSLKINSKYKDRLFCLIFGDETKKQNIISLYNALNGTNYSDDVDVKITTIDDAFAKPSPEGKFEWTATLINLNKGKNDELLKKCKPLEDYMFLINAIRENEADGLPIEEAVDKAVRFCIENNVLKEYIDWARAER